MINLVCVDPPTQEQQTLPERTGVFRDDISLTLEERYFRSQKLILEDVARKYKISDNFPEEGDLLTLRKYISNLIELSKNPEEDFRDMDPSDLFIGSMFNSFSRYMTEYCCKSSSKLDNDTKQSILEEAQSYVFLLAFSVRVTFYTKNQLKNFAKHEIQMKSFAECGFEKPINLTPELKKKVIDSFLEEKKRISSLLKEIATLSLSFEQLRSRFRNIDKSFCCEEHIIHRFLNSKKLTSENPKEINIILEDYSSSDRSMNSNESSRESRFSRHSISSSEISRNLEDLETQSLMNLNKSSNGYWKPTCVAALYVWSLMVYFTFAPSKRKTSYIRNDEEVLQES